MAGPLQGRAATAVAASGDRTPYERTPYGSVGGAGGKARHSRSARAAHLDKHQHQQQQQQQSAAAAAGLSSTGALSMGAGAARRGPYDRPSAGRHASAGPQAAARRSGARAGGGWVGSAASKVLSGASSFLASFFRRSESQEQGEQEQPLSPQMEANGEEGGIAVAEIVTVEEKVTEQLDVEGMLNALPREECDRFIKLLQSKLDETATHSHSVQIHAANGVLEDHGRRLYPDEELARDLQNRLPEVTQEHAATSPVDIAKAYMGKHLTPTPAMPVRTLDYLEASARKRDEFDSTPRVRIATPGHTPYVRLPPRYSEGIRPSPYPLTTREKKRRADGELDYGRKTRHKLSNGPPISTLGNGSYLERMRKVHRISKPDAGTTQPDAAAHVPTKSTVTAKKILETLEILTPPKGKRLEEEMALIRERRPEELSPSKLNDQARKSMQTVDYEAAVERLPPASNSAGPSSHDGAGPSTEGLLRVPASTDSKAEAASLADGEIVIPAVASELSQQRKGFRMSFMEDLNSDDEPSSAPTSVMDSKADKLSSAFTNAAGSSLSIGVKSGFSFPFAGNLPEPITPKPMPSPVPSSVTYPASREAATDRANNVSDVDVRPSVHKPLSKPEPATAGTASVSAPDVGFSNGSFAFETGTVQPFNDGEERSSKRQMSTVEDQKSTEAEVAPAPFLLGIAKPPVSFSFTALSNGALESSAGRETSSSSQAASTFGLFTTTISKSTIPAEPKSLSEAAAPLSGPSESTLASSPVFAFQSTTVTASAAAPHELFKPGGTSTTEASASPTEGKPLFGFVSTASLPASSSSPASSPASSASLSLFSSQAMPLFGEPAPAPFSGSAGSIFGASSSSATTTATTTTTTTTSSLVSSTTASTAPTFSSSSFSQPAASLSFGASTPSTSASLFSSPGTPFPFNGANTVAPTENASPNSNDMMEDAEEPSQVPPPGSTPLFGGQSSSQFTFGQSAPAFGAGSFGSGQTSVFGLNQSAPSFGTAQAAPAFGVFAAPSQPATNTFGASTSAFGTSQAPVFGSFSAQSTASFGSQSAPVFGAAASSPAFGAAASTPAFGAPASTPTFGAPSNAPLFGAAGSASAFAAAGSAPAFGAAGFGTAGSTPAFGAAQSSPPLFGGTQAQPFGAAQSTPAFGAGQSSAALFGQPGAAAAPSPVFGSSAPVFGSSQSAPSFQFGAAAQSAPAPSFGGSQPAFTFGASQSAAPSFGGPDFSGGGVFSVGAAGSTDPKSNRRIIKPRKTTAKRK